MADGDNGFDAATARVRRAFEADFDEQTTEHILLEGDGRIEAPEERSVPTRLTEARRLELRDRLRGRSTRLVLYEEGVLRVEQARRGGEPDLHRLDLRYLDPVPVVEHLGSKRALDVALVLLALAAAAAGLAAVGVPLVYVAPVATACGAAGSAALGIFWYRRRETATFMTLHGRAPALRLTAGLGHIRRSRAMLPELSAAIEDAAEDIGNDTRSYLRGEMREHYRLRGDGVFTDAVCSDSTGRILAQFDIDL